MSRLPFVDAHVHLWDLGRLRYPWLTPPFADDGPNGSVEPIARDYALEDYLADVTGWEVAGCVHVDAGADATQALEETDWLEGIAAERGLPSGIVAFAALDDPAVERLLEAQAARPHVRGIRHIVNWHPDPRRTYSPVDVTQDERWQAGYGLLGRYGLPFDLQCYPGQMPGLAPLIARHEDTPVIVNHLGMPVMTDADGLACWREGMRALAAIPHVAVKLSGLGFIWRDWDEGRVRPLLREVIDLFGPGRCLIASDSPTDKLFAPVDQTLRCLEAATADLSEDERRDVWGRNANRLYRLGLTI